MTLTGAGFVIRLFCWFRGLTNSWYPGVGGGGGGWRVTGGSHHPLTLDSGEEILFIWWEGVGWNFWNLPGWETDPVCHYEGTKYWVINDILLKSWHIEMHIVSGSQVPYF